MKRVVPGRVSASGATAGTASVIVSSHPRIRGVSTPGDAPGRCARPCGAGVTADATRPVPAGSVDSYPGMRGFRSTIIRGPRPGPVLRGCCCCCAPARRQPPSRDGRGGREGRGSPRRAGTGGAPAEMIKVLQSRGSMASRRRRRNTYGVTGAARIRDQVRQAPGIGAADLAEAGASKTSGLLPILESAASR